MEASCFCPWFERDWKRNCSSGLLGKFGKDHDSLSCGSHLEIIRETWQNWGETELEIKYHWIAEFIKAESFISGSCVISASVLLSHFSLLSCSKEFPEYKHWATEVEKSLFFFPLMSLYFLNFVQWYVLIINFLKIKVHSL